MTRDECEKMAEQVLTRGIQKTAKDILTSRDAEAENDSQTDTPPGFSDKSSKDEHQGKPHKFEEVIGRPRFSDLRDTVAQLSTQFA